MITVTYNGEPYECDRAVKGTDYIHLLNSDGTEVATFDGCSSFSGFTISGGTYEDATDHSNCKVAAVDCEGKTFRTDKCIDDLATSNNPIFTGSVSQNRKAGTTVGDYSHAEGQNTTASGNYSHAEGDGTKAIGNGSHAEGKDTIAKGTYQHVEGKYNVQDSNETYAHIVGGGTDADHRKNIYTLDWDGNAEFDGDVTDGDGNTLSQLHTDLTTHTGNTSNPHSVTKAQVGLGSVDNTSDLNKPISTATQTALDTINTDLTNVGNLVAVNLFKCTTTITPYTDKGITFFRNQDGTVSLKGTATGTLWLSVGSYEFKANETYTVSGCPSGGSANSHYMYVLGYSDKDTGNGMQYTAQADQTLNIGIYIASGKTVDLLFKPMIEVGTVKHAYQPYIGADSIPQAIANTNDVVGDWSTLTFTKWKQGYYDGSSSAYVNDGYVTTDKFSVNSGETISCQYLGNSTCTRWGVLYWNENTYVSRAFTNTVNMNLTIPSGVTKAQIVIQQVSITPSTASTSEVSRCIAISTLNENLTTLKTYSTTEQVVGEWIDGKPLYRKVINLSDTSIDSTANVVLATLENVDNIISLNGTYAKSNNGTILTYDNFGSVSATKINDVMMYYAFVLSYMNTELYPNSITMRAYDINGGGSYTLTLTRIIIVVEYTKTTDY